MKEQDLVTREHSGMTSYGYPGSRKPPMIIIYLSLLGLCGVIVILLPFIEVDISVRSDGILRSSLETTAISLSNSATVRRIMVRDNEEVQKGELMFVFQSPILDERILYLEGRIDDLVKFQRDLRLLLNEIKATGEVNKYLITGLYRQSYYDYWRRREDKWSRLEKAKKTFDRSKTLFQQDVIAAVEFEDVEFELKRATLDVELLHESQFMIWQKELRALENELHESRINLDEALAELKTLEVRAPVTGTIQRMIGLYPDTRVYSGQLLCEINPSTSLIAEVYVTPEDIGLLTPGMPVRIQIHALNHNLWGLIEGRILEISNVALNVGDRLVFKVVCRLESEFLTMKNGSRRNLKKGMTIQARFRVTRRSLWQLLSERTDDWINPSVSKNRN